MSGGPSVLVGDAVRAGRSLVDSIAAAFGLRGSGIASVPATATGPVRSVALTLALVDVGAELPDGIPVSILGALSLPASSTVTSSAGAGAGSGSTGSTGPSAALNLATASVTAAVSRDARVGGDLFVHPGRGPPGSDHFSAAVSTPGSYALNSVTRSTVTTEHGETTVVLAPQPPAFSPPAGAVHISATTGGTVRFGAATLTFAPGSLASDAWIVVTSHRQTVSGLITVSDVYDLHAYDALTGVEIHTFLVAPRLSVQVGSSAGISDIWYVDPQLGPQQIASSSTGGVVSAALPHFSPYVVATDSQDLIARIAGCWPPPRCRARSASSSPARPTASVGS